MQVKPWITAAMLAALSASSAMAEDAKFKLVLRGIPAGSLSWSGTAEPGGAYAVSGVLRTSGLAAMLKKVRYEAGAKGSLSPKGQFAATSYVEDANTGKRHSQSSIAWKGGVPTVKSSSERAAKPWDIEPAGQKGTVDPLTAMFAALREVPAGQECQVALKMFDGRRASQVTLSARQAAGEGVTCAGEYRRVAGFSPEDMAEKTRFPFTLTYAPGAEGRMRVVEVAMDTLYGKAKLVRE